MKFTKSEVLHSAFSDTFCIAPWVSLHLFPDGRMYPCTSSAIGQKIVPIGNVNEASVGELANSHALRELRVNILSRKRSEACSTCYKLEESGLDSPRKTMNGLAHKYRHLLEDTGRDGSVSQFIPRTWDVRFSNLCNQRCRSCGPDLSSSWAEDARKLFPANTSATKPLRLPPRVWDELEPFVAGADEFYFAGGEPLLAEEHYRILERLIECNRFDTKLVYTSNFSILKHGQTDVLRLWRRFENVFLHVSVDGLEGRGEYLRKGMDWMRLQANLARLKTEAPHVKVGVQSMLGAMNALHFPDIHRWVVEQGLDAMPFVIGFLDTPEYLSVQVLPPELKAEVCRKYEAYCASLSSSPSADRVIHQFELAMGVLRTSDRSYLLPEFRKTALALDAIRNERVTDVFPELAQLFEGTLE